MARKAQKRKNSAITTASDEVKSVNTNGEIAVKLKKMKSNSSKAKSSDERQTMSRRGRPKKKWKEKSVTKASGRQLSAKIDRNVVDCIDSVVKAAIKSKTRKKRKKMSRMSAKKFKNVEDSIEAVVRGVYKCDNKVRLNDTKVVSKQTKLSVIRVKRELEDSVTQTFASLSVRDAVDQTLNSDVTAHESIADKVEMSDSIGPTLCNGVTEANELAVNEALPEDQTVGQELNSDAVVISDSMIQMESKDNSIGDESTVITDVANKEVCNDITAINELADSAVAVNDVVNEKPCNGVLVTTELATDSASVDDLSIEPTLDNVNVNSDILSLKTNICDPLPSLNSKDENKVIEDKSDIIGCELLNDIKDDRLELTSDDDIDLDIVDLSFKDQFIALDNKATDNSKDLQDLDIFDINIKDFAQPIESVSNSNNISISSSVSQSGFDRHDVDPDIIDLTIKNRPPIHFPAKPAHNSPQTEVAAKRSSGIADWETFKSSVLSLLNQPKTITSDYDDLYTRIANYCHSLNDQLQGVRKELVESKQKMWCIMCAERQAVNHCCMQYNFCSAECFRRAWNMGHYKICENAEHIAKRNATLSDLPNR